MTNAAKNPKPVLKDGALYWADNGHVICAECAGASASYTGRDISGQKVERITAEEVAEWNRTMPDRPLRCDGSYRAANACTLRLSPIAGPDGWPMVA